jgi:hypothetical protein
LKAIYYPDTGFLEATVGNHASQIWRSIVEGLEVLKQGLIRRIGSRETTHAWNANWLPRDFALRPMVCTGEDPPTNVAAFIDRSTASWNVSLLHEFFLPLDIEVIRSIPICTRTAEDFWAWQYEKAGVFSVKSAYHMVVNSRRRRGAWLENIATSSNHQQEEKDWASLWKIKVPSKIRVFLWRLARNTIPTMDVRHHRNMVDNCGYSLCGEPDSWRHSLLECTMSRCVWALIPETITEHMERTIEPDAKHWFFSMMNTLKHEDTILCFVTLWAIWFARRKAIHEGRFQSPLSTHLFVETFIRDLEVASVGTKPTSNKAKPAVTPSGVAKINVDAAVWK